VKAILLSIAALAALVACGGGSSTGNVPVLHAATTVATTGTITAFGSVYVNGVRYDVTAARLTKNGQAVSQSSLAVGEVAQVTGQEDTQAGTGIADTVEVEDNIVGPIAAIVVNTAAPDQLTVMGQTVIVNASTSFGSGISPANLTGLKVGDQIEVSGMADATGNLAATRIARASAAEALQVVGSVSSLNNTGHTFMINGLTVDFSGATGSGAAPGHPGNGDSVVVSGTAFDSTAIKLTALTVNLLGNPTSGASGGRVEQEGLITTFTSSSSFFIGTTAVMTTGATVFKGGSASSLAANVRVEVGGTLNASGVLVADVVQIKQVAAIELEGPVTAVDSTNHLVTVLGVTVTADTTTRFEDRSSANVQTFTLSNVNVGDTVEIRGYENPIGSGKVQATRLERVPAANPTGSVMLRGAFTAATAPMFKILGITVDATNATFGSVEGGQAPTITTFFTLAVGQTVDVRGTFAGTTVTATDVRIDSQEDR
jgi:hypothetical protein